MKFNKIVIFAVLLFILIITINSISAVEYNNDTMLQSLDDDILSDSSKTIVVPFDPKNPNEVLLAKIQPAIDNASSGDTIFIEGSPVHCHLTINKTLTIIADESSTIDPCPHHTHAGLNEHGVFYITKGGSGSVIQGFNFINKDKAETPFSILIDGASDVLIKDCTINDSTLNVDKYVGIIIKNSNNIKLSNLLINNTINGITIINSTNIYITDCIFDDNENYAITVIGNSRNINISRNSITNNWNFGISLLSANYVNILDNLIENNGNLNGDSGSGIYVNTNITKLIVKGNIFLSNNLHAIMYDYKTRNLNNENGADQLTIVNDNFFSNHKSMILHHRIYTPYPQGTIHYDAENDVYGDVGTGNYIENKSYVYMQYAFIYMDTPCGFTYYTTQIPWTMEAPANGGKYNLSLKLSIKQSKNGVYSLSIVDSKGNIAKDFNAGYITFFLNDCVTVEPRSEDLYIKVPIKNGVSTADFRDKYLLYKNSSNTITAVFNGLDSRINRSPNIIFYVNNANIPISPTTTITSSKLTTFPVSDSYFSARLVDSKNHPISNQIISFKLDGKTYVATTDKNGMAKIKVSLTSKKTYSVYINYYGSDDYKSSKTTSSIIVKTGSKKSKIKSSNMKIKKNRKKMFSLKLLGNNGNILKNQKITVKINNKLYSLKTNSKGIAKISLKFKKVKKYKISIKYLGNNIYKAVSKTNTISVTK